MFCKYPFFYSFLQVEKFSAVCHHHTIVDCTPSLLAGSPLRTLGAREVFPTESLPAGYSALRALWFITEASSWMVRLQLKTPETGEYFYLKQRAILDIFRHRETEISIWHDSHPRSFPASCVLTFGAYAFLYGCRWPALFHPRLVKMATTRASCLDFRHNTLAWAWYSG